MTKEGLDEVRIRFTEWRKTRIGRERIPDPLWALCVRVARTHRISKVSKAAGVDYYSLKRRVERAFEPLTVSRLNEAPIEVVSKVRMIHPTGWAIEIDSSDDASMQWIHRFLMQGDRNASSGNEHTDLHRSPADRLQARDRIPRRICLGATAD